MAHKLNEQTCRVSLYSNAGVFACDNNHVVWSCVNQPLYRMCAQHRDKHFRTCKQCHTAFVQQSMADLVRS